MHLLSLFFNLVYLVYFFCSNLLEYSILLPRIAMFIWHFCFLQFLHLCIVRSFLIELKRDSGFISATPFWLLVSCYFTISSTSAILLESRWYLLDQILFNTFFFNFLSFISFSLVVSDWSLAILFSSLVYFLIYSGALSYFFAGLLILHPSSRILIVAHYT